MTGDAAAVLAAHNRRLRGLDPLVPEVPALRPPAQGVSLAAADGVGVVVRNRPDPQTLDATWTTALEERITLRIGERDPAATMAELLSGWVARRSPVDEADSSAIVSWPSRDTTMTPVFLRHGLVPKSAVAVRPVRAVAVRPAPSVAPVPDPDGGVTIRAAGPADLDAAAALQLELIRWDQQFGAMAERPSTVDALRADLAGSLAKDPAWTWIAEAGDRPLGLLRVSPPPEAAWIAPVVARAPAAYLSCLVVTASWRGSGVGRALVARAHAALDAAGVDVTLLHYAALSPFSPPFWHRAGYRPLWTTWHAVPVSRLRRGVGG
jgi:GNAT superfamily N-acetyltransferase